MEQTKENILPLTKNVNLIELFSKILNIEKENYTMKPSEYIKEMSLTTEQRHKKLVHIANTIKSTNSDYPLQFKIVPNILIFQKFEPRSTNSLILEIKNIGKTLLPVKLHCPNSIYFSANFACMPISKLAPGLSVEYEVIFTPKDAKDYFHYLVVTSKEHTFEIPIIAIGPRPVLDIPDQIVLSPAPVKISTNKFVVVRNIGNASAVFNFITQSNHFQVNPTKGILGVHDSMMLNILFESCKAEEVIEPLYLVLETGEKLLITLHGSAENICIRLEKNSVVHEDTFLGLKRCKSVRLINSSSNVIKFSWKKHKTQKEDLNIIESMKKKYKELAETEVLKDAKVIYYGLSNAEKHKISCERILKDELRLLEKEEFAFSHDAFSIMPQNGEVWPKGSVEMIISFEPKIRGSVSTEAYLEVSGKDSRLPLRIKGSGIGPAITLNLKTLDIDYAYLCSLHRYEVSAENRGDVPGTIEYVMEPLVFGGKIEVTPESRYLRPGELGTFVISFSSNRPGDFIETLCFTIKESQELVSLVLKGKIVNPTLHFNIKKLDFGVVPLGFPKRREVTINNLSMVPVTFSLRVSTDGDYPSISHEQFAKFTIKPSLPLTPKEFEIKPEESVIEPFSSKKVCVTLTSNKIGRFQKQLVVDLWDSENGNTSCPIYYDSQTPHLELQPEKIFIPFCFLNFPYTRSITLKNLSHICGFFYIVPSDPINETQTTCSSSIPQGVIEPHNSVNIDITIITTVLGQQIIPINILTFGLKTPQTMSTITCIGQGPVVTVIPDRLDWGEIFLIESNEKALEILNESPIPATLTIAPSKTNSLWSVNPSNITIEPEKSITVTVSVMLNDRGKSKDNLKINVYNGQDLQIPLSAIGIGSSLKLYPSISPVCNLGTLFSNEKYEFKITLENKGIKIYTVVWSPFSDFKLFANAKFVLPQELLFKIEPTKIDIFPGESTTVTLEVYSAVNGNATLTYYCFANLGGPVRELLLTSEVSANFIGPNISFDKSEIHFWLNIGLDEKDSKLNDTVCLKNTSVLPLCFDLSTAYPFCFEMESGECTTGFQLTLEEFENKEFVVKFIAQPNSQKYSKSFKGKLCATFKDSSDTFTVALKGEVNYPNVSIHPKNVDFGYVLIGTSACYEINMMNTGPLLVYYSINWNPDNSHLVQYDKIDSVKSIISCSTEEPEERADEPRSEKSCDNEAEGGGELHLVENATDALQNLTPPEKPFPKMPEIKVSNFDIKAALFPIARNYYICDEELMDAYKMVCSSAIENVDFKTNYNNFCDITPFYGTLEPFCSQVLTVTFFSNAPVNIRLEAVVQIKSGPTETITINAISSTIDFQLSTTELDFGKQLFCETKSQVLKIQNAGTMSFSYEVTTENENVCETNEKFPLWKGSLTVSPSSGTVKSFEEAELVVRYHPGVPGKFESIFSLQVAYLDPIIVKVKGYGVFPQVYASLPRPDILSITPEIGYCAVASITPDWILTGFASKTGMYDLHLLNPYRSRESALDVLSENESGEEKWEIINCFDSTPTEIDIYLAIERFLAYDLITKDSDSSATFAVYARTIPRFNVPAYELDFGVCVIGRNVEQEVTVTNFGPLPVVMYGIFDLRLKEKGIIIRLKNRNELKIGACLPFVVAFHPKKSAYKNKYQKLETVFYFEIYHGPKIPINITAEVTYPHVIPSTYDINFSEVICGCCKVINLRLKNPGLVKARWTMSIKKAREVSPTHKAENLHVDAMDRKTMFHLDYHSGVLEPDEYCSVQVSFKPQLGGSFSGVLYVYVAKSLSHIKIMVRGKGIEPKLNISKKVLNFKATLPFPNKIDKIFTVDNPCSFPIEFYFPEFDEQIYDEDKIIRALAFYYQTNEILMPVRKPGDGLPVEIVDFYNLLLEGLNTKFMEEEREKIVMEREKDNLEENLSSMASAEDDIGFGSNQNSFFDKKKKKFKRLSRSRTSLETSRDFIGGVAKEPYVPSIYEKKTPQEIEDMLKDYIMSLWSIEPAQDPIQAALKSVLPPIKEEEYREGTLIIFHGAPYTNSIQLANRVSVFINMWAVNIDRIVLEEAAFGRCKAGLFAKDLIEQAYFEYVGLETREVSPIPDWGESEVQNSEEPDFEKGFEEIQRKFKALVDLRENIISGKGKNAVPSSAKSDTSKKLEKTGTPVTKPQMNLNVPIANISEETVVDILRYRLALDVREGLIFEGLQSVIISSPTKALIALLKAVGNIRDIITVFFLSNYSHYSKFLSSVQEEQELGKLFLREEILNILEEEPEEVFESLNLGQEDAETLRALFLSRRHESHSAYEKKKETFYEIERLKKEALKKRGETPLPAVNLLTDTAPIAEKKEKDNAKKKDTSKNPKTSEVSNRKSESEAKSGKFKKDSVEGEFLSFETDFIEMKAIIDNWDQRLGAIVVDSVTEVKSKKNQTPRKVDSAAINKAKNGRGIFLWLVDVSKPDKNSFPAFCCYLKTSLQDRRIPSESDNWPLETTESMTFSVVPSPPKRTRDFPQRVFTIAVTENIIMMNEDACEDLGEYVGITPSINTKLNRSMSSISFKSKKKGSATSRRKRTDSRLSTDMKGVRSKKAVISAGIEENQLKPRWILQPGETLSYRIRYFPTQIGEWEHVYTLNVINWHRNNNIRCVGECDIPRIDMKPEVLFPAVQHNKPLTSLFVPAYYYSDDAYDFGSIITTQSIDEKKSTERTVSFNVLNKSALIVDLCVILAEDEMSDDQPLSENIKFIPEKLWLRPGEKKSLCVTATPAKLGHVSETLLLIIKDNPKVEHIKVSFEGVKASVSVSPKILNFDRLLLHRKEFRHVIFTNENTAPLFFTLQGLHDFPCQFTFSHASGWISPLGSFDLEIRYDATEIQLINEKPVFVQVFDNVDSNEPVQEFYFSINVEAYDVALDVIFSSLEDDHIDFGDIRVENVYTIEFNLKNVGKYQLGYKIDTDNMLLSESENDQFYVTPQEGKLIPGKLFPVSVTFVAQNEICWKREPLLRILLVEPYCADELVATIPIGVSARSHFAKYELQPSQQLNFGHIQVGTLTTGSVLIENKGRFSFSYMIELMSLASLLEGSADTAKKSSKFSASSKEKGEKGKKVLLPVSKVGPFEISPNSGIVESGQTAVVNISCCLGEVKNYAEKITIYVSECLPHLKKGNPLMINAEGCIPVIRFQDYKSIFREHFVCKDETELNSRTKPGTYTIFTENNNLFSFKNVCINKPVEARLHLQNAGLIECTVFASVSPSGDRESMTPTSVVPQYFTVTPEKSIIEPYSSECFIVTFQPEALEVYRARLTITLKMPDAFTDEVQIFELCGNGILPQIEITEPNTKLPEGQTLVNFPPVSPGHTCTSSITFCNTGIIDCKVIIELYKAENSVFSLIPKPGTEKMLKIWELIKPIDHTAVISMSPGQVAEFEVRFSPKEVKSYSSQIKLFIVDNPFENWCYKLVGEVFFEEVVIEKFRTAKPFLNEKDSDERSSVPIAPGQYFINFSDCYVKKKSKVLLRLSNKTEKDYFKFEWDEVQSISISPIVGHLYPNSYKEILLVFYTEEPMELEDVTISCLLNKIILDCPPEPSWDSRLIQYKKQPVGSSNSPGNPPSYNIPELPVITGEEPNHEVVPESNRMLYVNVSGIADYAKLSCEVTKITFKNTFMFQTRIFPLVLENSGNVALEYKLTLTSVALWPLKENKMSQVAEKSLLGLQELNSRPHSSVHLSSSESNRRPPLPSRCSKRPRPLTSVSVLDLNKSFSKCDATEQPVGQINEEQSTTIYNPFAIENSEGRIQPKEKASCNIVFAPMDINEYKAIITIRVENLHPECSLPEIEVTASSVMPYCHFDIPESDYLESGRRDHSQPGPIGYAPGVPLHPNTKTIEIKVLGIGVTVPIKFHVINPTEEDFYFSWVNVTQIQPGVVSSFHCSTTDGPIRAGRQQLMVFSFVSQKIGITESFWKFSISKHGVETPFLFVADVRKPAIYFLTSHVNLKPTVVGSSSSEVVTLVNQEENPFEFYFLTESLYSEGRFNCLKVEPSSGKILPNSELCFRVSFTGRTPGKVLFSVKCKIKSIKEPFTVTVEAVTYVVQPLIAFEDLKKVKHYPDINKENIIDFGSELSPNVPKSITLTFTSLSKTSFYYEWEYDQMVLETYHCKLKFSVKNGHVASFSRGKCDITILFYKKSCLMCFPVNLKIKRGPIFHFLINGSASTPLCELSFHSYDFGYCFLEEKTICFYETSLIIRNKDATDIFIECVLPESSAFSYFLPDAVICPAMEMIIPLSFHPKECVLYEDTIKIIINGNYEKNISLKGHGTEFKVILADPEDTSISLGAVRVGKTSCRKFSLINKSLATATLLVGFSYQFPVDGWYLAKPKEYFLDLSQDHRLTGVITISPSTLFRIKPQEVVTLSVTYTPKCRSSTFSETLSLQHQEKVEPLCMVTGCCLGPEISLDKTFLNFGAVVQSCASTLKLKLVNSGSVGVRFEWRFEYLSEYCISPAWGYCSPESDVTIHITFCPTKIQNCIKNSAECKLYLSDDETYPPQRVDVIGDCVALPEPLEVITFECLVRQTDSKTVEIVNSSGNEWQLVPSISGEFFEAIDAFIVPPLSSEKFQVNYCPLTMTAKEEFHLGTLFFKLPNGKGLMYHLKGISFPPDAEETIEREIPCKTKYVELLKVKNWLQYPQRFRVNISCVDNHDDPVCNCSGFEYLEVPALAQKEYSLNFFAYNVGYLRFHVTFVNEETKEYIWYDIGFNVSMCGPLEVIALKSGVRQTCNYELKLENPLKHRILYELETTSPEVHFDSVLNEVFPEQTIYVTVSFTPIHPGEKVEKLTATCSELGVFPRDLRLTALEALPEPPRKFETPLGTSCSQDFIIKNLSNLNAVLNFKADSEDFMVNENGSVSAGQSTQIKVTYEPSEIGSVTATLFVESEQAGNFIFPLVGMCVKPLAKGPFTLKAGSGVNIPFKNVFKKAKEFHMYVDNPAFVLKTAQETLLQKEESKIFVGLQKIKGLERLSEFKETEIKPKFPLMGQLVVECFNPYVKWQFYLKGILDK